MSLRSAGSSDFDPAIDPVLKGVPSRAAGQVDLVALFSDEAIDRMLRDVPGRMTAIRPLSADRHRRGVVDLEAMASSLRVAAPLVEPAARGRFSTAGVEWPHGQVRRFARSAGRVVREAISVAVVLSLVVGLFSVSVMTSTWLSPPLLNAARTGVAVSRGDRAASPARPHASASVDGRVASAAAPIAVPGEDEDRGGRAGQESSTLVADVAGGGSIDTSGGRAGVPRGGHVARAANRGVAGSHPAGRGVPGAEGTRRDVGGEGAWDGDGRLEAGPLELRAAPMQASGGAIVGSSRSGAFDLSEPLRVVAARPAVSRIIPYHRGYDLAFEITRGESPFVDPSLTPILAVDQPPLSRRTDSFDAAVRFLAALQNTHGKHASSSQPVPQTGLLAAARRERLRQAVSALRVEDVLAAVPPPDVTNGADRNEADGAVAVSGKPDGHGPMIRLSGAASLSGRPSSRLVEICVTAPPLPAARRPVGEIVYVLDGSASAGAEEAWPAICRGLDDAVRLLGPSSSITVVVFADRPVVVARGVPPSGFAAVREQLAGFRIRGSGDLHGCMQIVRGLGGERCVVVAHAGSIARAERDGDSDLAAWRRLQAGDGKVSLAAGGDRAIDVVEVDAASGATGESIGRRGGSPVDGVGIDSIAIRRSIVESSVGVRPHGRLEACRLEVAFDPAQVAAYRLVGHRRQVLDMTDGRSSAIDLFPGECVRVVYEVVLREIDPRGGRGASKAGDVVRATVRYRAGGTSSGVQPTEATAIAGISAPEIAVDPPSDEASGGLVWLVVAVAEQSAGSAHVDSIQRLRERIREQFDRSGGSPVGVDMEGNAADGRLLREQLHALWSAL